MASRRRQQGGKTEHAEGMHGDLTHEAILKQLKHKVTSDSANTPAVDDAEGGEKTGKSAAKGSLKAHAPAPNGKHRLFEGRQQHDEADKDSERNRLAREVKGPVPGEK